MTKESILELRACAAMQLLCKEDKMKLRKVPATFIHAVVQTSKASNYVYCLFRRIQMPKSQVLYHSSDKIVIIGIYVHKIVTIGVS
jgi:hypothetical protein